MTPLELTLLGFLPALALVFSAGRVVESIRNGKYQKKEMCDRIHKDLTKAEDDFRSEVRETLKHIREWMEKHK